MGIKTKLFINFGLICWKEAFEAYKVAKEVHIKVVANMWRGKVDEEVYESLLKYEVDIGD